MGYLSNLKWQQNLKEYNENEKRVLLALSSDEYNWRTRDRLKQLSKLPPDVLDDVLAGLLKRKIIRISFSKNRNIIYGLIERVGT